MAGASVASALPRKIEVDRARARRVNSVVGQNHIDAAPAHAHAGRIAVQRVVDRRDVFQKRNLRLRIEQKIRCAVENDVVSNNGVRHRVDAFQAIPNHVTLDQIRAIGERSVNENARIGSIVNNVIANDVRVRSDFDFDAVALRRAAQNIVNPIVFE